MRSGVMSSTRMGSAPRRGSITVKVWFFLRLVSGPFSCVVSNGIACAKLRRNTSRSAPARKKLPSMSAQ